MDSLKQFLDAWEKQQGLKPSEPEPAPADGSGEEQVSPAESSAGADTEKAPSAAVGAQTAAEEAQKPQLPEVQPQLSQPSEEVTEEEVEGEEEFLPELSADEIFKDIDEIQFLTNPKAVLSEIVKRLDSHYRRALTDLASGLSQVVELQVQWSLVNAFFDRNPDLLPHRAIVNEVAEELKKDPRFQQLTIPQRMEVLAQLARERLKANATATEGVPPAGVVRGTPPPPADEQQQKVKQFIEAYLRSR